MADQSFIIVDQDGTEHEFPAGMDPQKAAGIVRAGLASAVKPIAADEPDTYEAGFARSVGDTMKGTIRGIGRGVAKTFDPRELWRAVKAKDAADHGQAPAPDGDYGVGKVKALGQSLTTPEGGGEMLGTLGAGVLAGRFGPASVKGAAGAAGRMLTTAGEHPWVSRVAGAGSVAAGIYKMDPELVAAGVGASVAPEVMKYTGTKLRQFAGESPAVIRLGRKGVEKINSEFGNAVAGKNIRLNERDARAASRTAVDPAVRLQDQFETAASRKRARYDTAEDVAARKAAAEAQRVQENADRLAAIEQGREGMEAGKPSFRESLSAKTPEGGSTSMSRSYKAAEDATAGSDEALLRAAGLDPSKAVSVKPGARKGAVDTTSGRTIRISGKAAKDLAEGRVPPTSKAPMPSDARMDELVQKLGGRRSGETPGLQAPREDLWDAGRRSEALGQAAVGSMRSGASMPGVMTPTEMLPGSERVATSTIPPSRSSRPMSATPGLSEQDSLALGISPKVRILDLKQQAIDKMLEARSGRHGVYRDEAGIDAFINALLKGQE